ncbi:MAG: type II secretion system protein N [Proteobacteria bacterium]|nr:type II secretion system protein N [Pseudomonadota bacterium]
MRARVARFAIAAVLAVAAAVLFAPATLVDALVGQRTQGALRLADARGLWWHGSGTLAATASPARLALGWRVGLGALARGALDVALTVPGGTPFANVEVTRSRVRFARVDARIPAAIAAAFAAPAGMPAGTLAAGGVLALESPGFQWADGRGEGSLEARWQRARVVFAGLDVDFGDVELALRPQSGSRDLRGTLANRGGDLALSGDVVVSGPTVSATLALAPRVTTPGFVRGALALLGSPDQSGIVHVAWTSRL